MASAADCYIYPLKIEGKDASAKYASLVPQASTVTGTRRVMNLSKDPGATIGRIIVPMPLGQLVTNAMRYPNEDDPKAFNVPVLNQMVVLEAQLRISNTDPTQPVHARVVYTDKDPRAHNEVFDSTTYVDHPLDCAVRDSVVGCGGFAASVSVPGKYTYDSPQLLSSPATHFTPEFFDRLTLPVDSKRELSIHRDTKGMCYKIEPGTYAHAVAMDNADKWDQMKLTKLGTGDPRNTDVLVPREARATFQSLLDFHTQDPAYNRFNADAIAVELMSDTPFTSFTGEVNVALTLKLVAPIYEVEPYAEPEYRARIAAVSDGATPDMGGLRVGSRAKGVSQRLGGGGGSWA